jgi:hypothetical protein
MRWLQFRECVFVPKVLVSLFPDACDHVPQP